MCSRCCETWNSLCSWETCNFLCGRKVCYPEILADPQRKMGANTLTTPTVKDMSPGNRVLLRWPIPPSRFPIVSCQHVFVMCLCARSYWEIWAASKWHVKTWAFPSRLWRLISMHPDCDHNQLFGQTCVFWPTTSAINGTCLANTAISIVVARNHRKRCQSTHGIEDERRKYSMLPWKISHGILATCFSAKW